MILQVPQACLVAGGRMVCTARELESKHGSDGAGDCGDYGCCMEYQCGEGI